MSRLLQRLARAIGVIVAAAGLCGTATTVGPLTQTASAGTYLTLSTFDSRLLADINHARTARGIRRLIPVAGPTDVAHGWSCRLALLRSLAHNPRLGRQLATPGSYTWTTYGANVRLLSSPTGACPPFRANMNTPANRS